MFAELQWLNLSPGCSDVQVDSRTTDDWFQHPEIIAEDRRQSVTDINQLNNLKFMNLENNENENLSGLFIKIQMRNFPPSET